MCTRSRTHACTHASMQAFTHAHPLICWLLIHVQDFADYFSSTLTLSNAYLSFDKLSGSWQTRSPSCHSSWTDRPDWVCVCDANNPKVWAEQSFNESTFNYLCQPLLYYGSSNMASQSVADCGYPANEYSFPFVTNSAKGLRSKNKQVH